MEVTKRFYAETLLARFRDIELRIGMVDVSDAGLAPLTKNPLCGTYKDPTDEHVASFLLERRTRGRFLTVQSFHNISLDVNEIDVFL